MRKRAQTWKQTAWNVSLMMLAKQCMINAVGTNQKQILSLSNLKHNLINDPDLASVPPELLPRYSDTICSHWLRLHLIFQWIWKNFLHEMLFSTCGIYNRWRKIHRQFCIRDGKGFLSFLRLVGTSYIKKYASAFNATTPQSHYTELSEPNRHMSIKQQHINWLDDVRNNIWDRTQFEYGTKC